MKAPASFTQVEGWREAFEAAWARLSNARTDSLFPEVPTVVCGEPVRLLTLRDYTILSASGSPLINGGQYGVMHAIKVLWHLHATRRRWTAGGLMDRAAFALMARRVMRLMKYDETAIIADVSEFIDDAFLDMAGKSAKPKPTPPTQYPRKSLEISLCGEILKAYPSFTYVELRNMPLAQFWQWLHASRLQSDPDYRNDQLTDEVNRKAAAELNRLRNEEKK
jgi:hypothetical protein